MINGLDKIATKDCLIDLKKDINNAKVAMIRWMLFSQLARL